MWPKASAAATSNPGECTPIRPTTFPDPRLNHRCERHTRNYLAILALAAAIVDERAAADDGQAARDQLLEQFADVLTPCGSTPRQTGASPDVTLLPIIEMT